MRGGSHEIFTNREGDQQFFCCFQGGQKFYRVFHPVSTTPPPPRELKNDNSLIQTFYVLCVSEMNYLLRLWHTDCRNIQNCTFSAGFSVQDCTFYIQDCLFDIQHLTMFKIYSMFKDYSRFIQNSLKIYSMFIQDFLNICSRFIQNLWCIDLSKLPGESFSGFKFPPKKVYF